MDSTTTKQSTLGKYTVLKNLGSGGSCKVRLAKNTENGQMVALKILNDGMDRKM